MRTAPMIDDPDGYEYTPAPPEVQTMLRMRFEDNGITAMGALVGGYRHNIENWWDGAHIVFTDDGETFYYTNPHTRETDRFDFTGYYQQDGTHVAW